MAIKVCSVQVIAVRTTLYLVTDTVCLLFQLFFLHVVHGVIVT